MPGDGDPPRRSAFDQLPNKQRALIGQRRDVPPACFSRSQREDWSLAADADGSDEPRRRGRGISHPIGRIVGVAVVVIVGLGLLAGWVVLVQSIR